MMVVLVAVLTLVASLHSVVALLDVPFSRSRNRPKLVVFWPALLLRFGNVSPNALFFYRDIHCDVFVSQEGHNFLLWDQWDSIIFKFAIIRFHHFGQENTLRLAGPAQKPAASRLLIFRTHQLSWLAGSYAMSSYPWGRNLKTDDTHTDSTFDVAEAERQEVFARSIYQRQQEYGDETCKSRGERRLSRLSDEGGIPSKSTKRDGN
ncbi:hypothetical protein Hypma_015079 [Hypsizygus marmoreus]|uniref:Uncharacterized protein n=1 Tax=Hypsizygus marmoreus TaxID=39966 RepID=A0A369K6U3_HYPMA|nr:hypothetical protein Hypma_015079 [Hypsizygus marmoreus]